MSRRHRFAAAFVLAIGGVATGGLVATADSTAASAEPQVFNIMIDGKVDEFNGSFFAFYPNHVTAHPGDTLVFTSVFTGEPHSIAFGTAVQPAVELFFSLTPEQQHFEEEPPPEVMAAIDEAFAAIPPMLPEGEGDAIQSSVNGCFVPEGGEIPTDPATMCEVTAASPFTGTEVFYNSGFLPDTMTFEMQLADELAPGTYFGLCTLHFVSMPFTLEVVAPDVATPTPDEVAAEGLAALEVDAAALEPGIDAAMTMAADMPGHVLAGTGTPESQHLIIQFLPEDVTVAAGDPLTWTVAGPHTITFNAPESARTLLAQGDDGGYHLNPEGLTAAGFDAPAPPEGEATEGTGHDSTMPAGTEATGTEATGTEAVADVSAAPEGPPEEEAPPPVDAGTWTGEGFFNSGIMFEGDFTMRFSEPGTYEYECLIHPGMQGTVTVT